MNSCNVCYITMVHRDGAADQLRTKTPRGTKIDRFLANDIIKIVYSNFPIKFTSYIFIRE